LTGAIVMWTSTEAWKPPFPYRSGYVPNRPIHSRVEFTRPAPARTEALRRRARAETLAIYQNDPVPLLQTRATLKDRLFELVGTHPDQPVTPELLQGFFGVEENTQELLAQLRTALSDEQAYANWETAVERVFSDLEKNGLLKNMTHQLEDDDQTFILNQTAILVHPVGDASFLRRAESEHVRITEVQLTLESDLVLELKRHEFSSEDAAVLATAADHWLRQQGLPVTLTLDVDGTEKSRRSAEEAIEEQFYTHHVDDKLADAGKPLSTDVHIPLLELEHRQYVANLSWGKTIRHSLAAFGMYAAFYTLCGAFIVFNARYLLTDFYAFLMLVLTVVVTIVFTVYSARAWHAEIVPLAMCGITLTIAFGRDLALLVGVALALVVTMSLGQGIAELVILVAAVSSCVLFLGRIRSRTKLISVSVLSGAVTAATAIGVGTYVGQSFISPGEDLITEVLETDVLFTWLLFQGAGWFALCTVVAGVIMTGLLPFIERIYDVQTDLSLLELGDARHSLLQQLAQRAPGTYNHSINVASLSEAAAEAIGANGLLLRVGAYFHDIGKMTQPEYFVENQGVNGSRHEALLPAMSTLVIIAHVKDGLDLARQHHLPRPIIDFIEQHHGTTLVEYFYDQAAKQSEDDPDTEVDETSFRYPGRKPQTKEAGVMMVADAVESASRTLVEPAPARIESLVHEIVLKRLLDGQFDDCGLTLNELHLIQDSLVKSLQSVYHSRIKYPDQRSAS
jgi:putative nucleotidyltransferase with HDIG domain